MNTPTRLIAATGSSEFLDVHAQNVGKPHQDAVAIDAALAALDLGQPRLGPADQPGKYGL